MSTVKYYIFTVVILSSSKEYQGDFKAYFPPSSLSRYPRLVLGTLPTLNEFTFCSWIRLFNSHKPIPHIFSYGTDRYDDEIAIYFSPNFDRTCIRNSIQVRTKIVNYDCCFANWKEVSWNHICARWFGPDGSTEFFVNGRRCSGSGNTSISAGESVPGGGIVVLGQDQDAPGSGFSLLEAWDGEMTGVNLWSEVLSEDQIKEAGNCDGKRNAGNVIAWSKTPMTALDGIIVQEAEVCERY